MIVCHRCFSKAEDLPDKEHNWYCKKCFDELNAEITSEMLQALQEITDGMEK